MDEAIPREVGLHALCIELLVGTAAVVWCLVEDADLRQEPDI